MSVRQTGRAAVVTGGAKGIGAGTARRLEAEGAEVVVWDLEAVPWAAAEIVDVRSKAAVERGLRRHPRVAPAAIDTERLRQPSVEHVATMIAKSPMRRLGRVEEVAALVAWSASAECSFGTGAVFDLSGGRATS